MRHSVAFTLFLMLLFLIAGSGFSQTPSSEISQDDKAVTTGDPEIPLDELEYMLVPMTSDELLVEAEGWLVLLKETVTRISEVQLALKQKNELIDQKKEVVKDAKTENAEEKAEEKIDALAEGKKDLLTEMNDLQNVKISRIDHLNRVLKAVTAKVGLDAGGLEPEEVRPYRRYINAVSGVEVDVSDIQAAWANIYGWLLSAEGGIRWLFNFLKFIGAVVIFWVLSRVAGKIARKALTISPSNSTILNDFIISSSQRLTLVVGILVGLAALEVNIGPVIAIIGAASFVVAFALQGTLSNFASGIMIMFYRPFDVGDLIDVNGEYGKVKSMTLVYTSVMTLDNKLMVVPNNDIWGKTITNATKSLTRRVDMVFGISYSDNIEQAMQVMNKILADHPKVLTNPEPVVRLHELGDSSVNFVCRPWAKTADYWDVYWDVTRQVKETFDAEGISIPFPQRDVHMIKDTA